MAIWGSAWGFPFPWGGADLGDEWACALSQERVLIQHPDAPGERIFRDWICAFSEQAGDYLDVAADVRAAFALDSAVGVQLDMIGSMIGLPRSGFDDTRYRLLLQIVTSLLIGATPANPDWTGTTNNILSICRQFIGVAVIPPVVLHSSPPYSFVLTVPGLAVADIPLLFRFVCRAIFAGVLGQMIIDLDGLVFCNVILPDTPFAGYFCNAVAADTPGCAVFDHAIPIGDGAC